MNGRALNPRITSVVVRTRASVMTADPPLSSDATKNMQDLHEKRSTRVVLDHVDDDTVLEFCNTCTRLPSPLSSKSFRNRCGTMALFEGSVMPTVNSFGTRTMLPVGDGRVTLYSLRALQRSGYPEIGRLPYSMKVLLENLLRHEDGRFVKASDVEALAHWDLKSAAQKEISFAPARVLLQDFSGVPA